MTWLPTLRLDSGLAELVAVALLGAIDDLELRARIAEQHDGQLGPAAAAGYRLDIACLQTVLDRLDAPGRHAPDPHQAAVLWIDGRVYALDGEHRPVAMAPVPTGGPWAAATPTRRHLRLVQPRRTRPPASRPTARGREDATGPPTRPHTPDSSAGLAHLVVDPPVDRVDDPPASDPGCRDDLVAPAAAHRARVGPHGGEVAR